MQATTVNEFPLVDSRFNDLVIPDLTNEELYKVLNDTKKDIAYSKLENHLIEDFLQRNDPKLLIGISTPRQFSHKVSRIQFAGVNSPSSKEQQSGEYGGFVRTRSSDRTSYTGFVNEDSSSIKTSLSKHTATTIRAFESPRVTMDSRINYIMKIELAEKLCEESSQKLAVTESQFLSEIRNLTANIKELRTCNTEIIQTKETFQKFINSLALDQINTRIPAEKFLRFIEGWIKNGLALVGKERLQLTALKQQIETQQALLSKKADLNVRLRPIDFEQLQIEKVKFEKQIEEKNNHLIALKKVTGRAGLALNYNQHKLKSIEQHSKKLASDASSIEKQIARLEREANSVQSDLFRCEKGIEKLHQDMKDFIAPSTLDYVNVKHKLKCYEKEKKFLERQIYILNIKLSNTKTKYRKSNNNAIERETLKNTTNFQRR